MGRSFYLFAFILAAASLYSPARADLPGAIEVRAFNPDLKIAEIKDSHEEDAWEDGAIRVVGIHHQSAIPSVKLVGRKIVLEGGFYEVSSNAIFWKTGAQIGTTDILGLKVEVPFAGNDKKDVVLQLPVRRLSLNFRMIKPLPVSIPSNIDLKYSENGNSGRMEMVAREKFVDQLIANLTDYFEEPLFSKYFAYDVALQVEAPELLDEVKKEGVRQLNELIKSKKELLKKELRNIVERELKRDAIAGKAIEALTKDFPRIPVEVTGGDASPLLFKLTAKPYGWLLKMADAPAFKETLPELEKEKNKVVVLADRAALTGVLRGYLKRESERNSKALLVPYHESDSGKVAEFFSHYGEKIRADDKYDVAIADTVSPEIIPWGERGAKNGEGRHLSLVVPFKVTSRTTGQSEIIKLALVNGIRDKQFVLHDVIDGKDHERGEPAAEIPGILKVKSEFLSAVASGLEGREYKDFHAILSKMQFMGDKGAYGSIGFHPACVAVEIPIRQ